ncbi:MAG: biotin--[acetyl-CoA-carboxylase] ligase [Hyphomicrobiales bacterium]|nr:MAG: biotin--[acetyl-CoA-carboxylase] ligase [Hyphomicrobiales bacterium]
MIDDSKLAGLLLERVGDAVVVGIGVNLAHAPDVPDRAVTSLAAKGHSVERNAFARALELCWAQALHDWHAGAWDRLRGEWLARAHPFGTALKVHGADGSVITGTFAGLDLDGALQLQLSSGTRRTIHAGEVDFDRRC